MAPWVHHFWVRSVTYRTVTVICHVSVNFCSPICCFERIIDVATLVCLLGTQFLKLLMVRLRMHCSYCWDYLFGPFDLRANSWQLTTKQNFFYWIRKLFSRQYWIRNWGNENVASSFLMIEEKLLVYSQHRNNDRSKSIKRTQGHSNWTSINREIYRFHFGFRNNQTASTWEQNLN